MEEIYVATATVVYHREEDDSWWADSPDLPGFTAVGATLAETRELSRSGVCYFTDDPALQVLEQMPDGSTVVDVSVSKPSWLKAAWTIMAIQDTTTPGVNRSLELQPQPIRYAT